MSVFIPPYYPRQSCNIKSGDVILMDDGEYCHLGYIGDSICGTKCHFGNQATTANLPLLTKSGTNGDVCIGINGLIYHTGRK